MPEVALDAFKLVLNATQVSGCGLDQLQLRACRGKLGDSLLEVGVGHPVVGLSSKLWLPDASLIRRARKSIRVSALRVPSKIFHRICQGHLGRVCNSADSQAQRAACLQSDAKMLGG